jgi:hypothetical protein
VPGEGLSGSSDEDSASARNKGGASWRVWTRASSPGGAGEGSGENCGCRFPEAKIQGWHRDRLAVVCVRQSSGQQIVDHGESTRLQYGLAGRCWPDGKQQPTSASATKLRSQRARLTSRPTAELLRGHCDLDIGKPHGS